MLLHRTKQAPEIATYIIPIPVPHEPLESPFHLMWSIALAKAESASKILEKVWLLLDIR